MISRSHIGSAVRRITTLPISFLFLLVLFTGVDAMAQSAMDADSAESLTTELAAAEGEYQSSASSSRAAAEDNLARVAVERGRQLAAMVAKDPGRVLRLAMPNERRAKLPARVRAIVEEPLTAQGELEVLTEDYAKTSRTRYFLKEKTGRRLEMHFARQAPALRSGTTVKAKGVRVEEMLALESGTNAEMEVVAPALSSTFGDQRTVVILVNFANNPGSQPYTTAYAQNVVFNQTSAFYQAGSFGQTTLSGDVYGWFTIAATSTGCDYNAIASQADAAATAAGVNLSSYRRKVYGFPSNGCSWWGLGTVGGNPSRAWINGSFALQVVGHEMGHNFGLYHSHSMDCGTEVVGTGCTTSEYGDNSDIMGWSTGHFTAFGKERLGWLNYNAQPAITTVTESGIYTLDAYETASSGPKALKVEKSVDTYGRKTWYYLEYRQATNTPRGVLLHLGTDSSASSSYLLDGTPLTTSFTDAALPMEQTYTDSAADVSITPVSPTGTGVTIRIDLGGAPPVCVPAEPVVTMNPPQSTWVPAGTTVDYTVTVSNRDSAACGETTFSLSSGVPTDWTGVYSTPTLTLAAGAQGTAVLSVTSAATAVDGFYTVTAAAGLEASVNGAALGSSASATYVVASTTTTLTTAGAATVTRNKRIAFTSKLQSNTASVKRRKVTLTIIKPNGTTIVRKPLTDGKGVARSGWKPTRRDTAGVYQVTTVALVDGVQMSAETITFNVQ